MILTVHPPSGRHDSAQQNSAQEGGRASWSYMLWHQLHYMTPVVLAFVAETSELEEWPPWLCMYAPHKFPRGESPRCVPTKHTQSLVPANTRLQSLGLLHGWRLTLGSALGNKWTLGLALGQELAQS